MSCRPPTCQSRPRAAVVTTAAAASSTSSMAPVTSGTTDNNLGSAHHMSLEDNVGLSRPLSVSSSVSSFSIPAMMDTTKLYEVYTKAFCDLSALRKENKSLRAVIANLEVKLEVRSPGAAGTRGGNTTAQELVTDIKKWGHHFGVFFTPSLQYASAESQALGITLELYECLPSKYHDLMKLATQSKGKAFISTFRSAMGSSRSSTVLTLRGEVCPKVFAISSEYFVKNYPQNSVPKIQVALGFSVGEDGKAQYQWFPPFLYMNEDTSHVEFRFRNERLFMMARAILFGSNAATDKACAYAGAASTYMRSDRPAEATFGLIAYVSVTTHYILSIDDRFDFKGVGPKTGINYASDFNFYKQWLIEAQERPETSAYTVAQTTVPLFATFH